MLKAAGLPARGRAPPFSRAARKALRISDAPQAQKTRRRARRPREGQRVKFKRHFSAQAASYRNRKSGGNRSGGACRLSKSAAEKGGFHRGNPRRSGSHIWARRAPARVTTRRTSLSRRRRARGGRTSTRGRGTACGRGCRPSSSSGPKARIRQSAQGARGCCGRRQTRPCRRPCSS